MASLTPTRTRAQAFPAAEKNCGRDWRPVVQRRASASRVSGAFFMSACARYKRSRSSMAGGAGEPKGSPAPLARYANPASSVTMIGVVVPDSSIAKGVIAMTQQASPGTSARFPRLDRELATQIEQSAYPCWEGARALQAVADIAVRDGALVDGPEPGFPMLAHEDLACLLRSLSIHIELGHAAMIDVISEAQR